MNKLPENNRRSTNIIGAIPFDMILGCYYHTKLRLHSPDGYSATPLQKFSIDRPLTRIAMLGIRFRSL
jgi:hypothetical protein